MAEEIGKGLHGQLQRSLTSDKNTALDRTVFFTRNKRTERRTSCIANGAKYGLVVHADIINVDQARRRDAIAGCAGFCDGKVTRFEISTEGLCDNDHYYCISTDNLFENLPPTGSLVSTFLGSSGYYPDTVPT